MDKITRILIISTDATLREVLNFCFDGWGYEVFLKDTYNDDVSSVKKISPDVIVVDVHAARQSDLKICTLLKNDPLTAFIPVITLIDKRQLRARLLNLQHSVDDYLIKPPDPLDLRVRIEMAIRRSQYSLYASPLTGLPGNAIIEEVVKERLKKKTHFSFAYIDIDNFKCFNDTYGYMKGDKALLQTSYLLYSSLRAFGNPDDFIGHIGGDDFVFISSPEKYEAICRHFITEFDRLMPFHYGLKERQQGFVLAEDRTHTMRRIPLMSISIAIVNKRDATAIKSIVEINEKVSEIKKYIKGIQGSKFMADRRDQTAEAPLKPYINNHAPEPLVATKPLGQILVERKMISVEQLEEALLLHWKRGIVLGEILREQGILNEESLAAALELQNTVRRKTMLHVPNL